MKRWISSLFTKGSCDKGVEHFTDDEGVNFYCSTEQFQSIKRGESNDFLTAQYVALKMLEEEGKAESIPNGFIVAPRFIAALEEDVHQLLELPPIWNGAIVANIQGTTKSSRFSVELTVESPSGRITSSYRINGPMITFGESEFALKGTAFEVFDAYNVHQQSVKGEANNLRFLYELQQAQEKGANLKLGHFDKLKIHIPDTVAVEAELDSQGNLILTPSMGQDASYEQMQRVLGQLQTDGNTLKVGDEIILFNEQTAAAAREIISNRKIPKQSVQQFLKTPSAFLNASLVNLDVGFSLRVKGVSRFKHAYFGETDESGIDWFASNSAEIRPFSAITRVVKTSEDLLDVERLVADAQATGATEVAVNDVSFDISCPENVEETINKLRTRVAETEQEYTDVDEPQDDSAPELEEDKGPWVVDIALNDDTLDSPSKLVEEALHSVLYEGKLDWSNHKRSPYPHQDVGVNWFLGLEYLAREKELLNGALLADDMGLGKTFMALSGIDHYYRQCDSTGRPTLIVAPLSLLENWKDEVGKTFYTSPFNDIVILQSDGDLNRFRVGGAETKGRVNEEGEPELRYSLKFGSDYPLERLDIPKRLVITTYQTLRDYQFSLSQIDWGIVVFDEAQNIKNPNALQTRAAKALKAKFKLLATGTPVENSLADFWCLMDTACPGFLDSYQNFRRAYIAPILQAAGDEAAQIRAQLGRQLREKVGALMLRRVKEDNLEGLPSKTIYVGLQGDGWQYEPMIESTMADYQLKVYDGAIEAQNQEEDAHALTTLARLRDSSLHPRLADGGRLDMPKRKRDLHALFEESAKLSSVIKILEAIQNRGEKCIIFAVNKRLQRFLSVALGSYFDLGPLFVINGDAKAVSKREGSVSRKTMIADFEQHDGFNIIVMSPVAAGVGLTVVGANNVIHFERHWNPAKEAQATDRVYRIGQEKNVNIYIPLLHHPSYESFDVNLHRLLSQKSMLKDAVVTPGEVLPNPTGSDGSGGDYNKIVEFDDVQRLSWKQFEALCVELLAREYGADSAWLTKDGADFGADGVLVLSDSAILLQAKHKKGSYKGHSAVQEVANASELYSRSLKREVTHKIFITNATKLAKSTRNIAKQLSVDVIDGIQVEALCKQHEVRFEQIHIRLNKKRYFVH
ncbi:SNF2-related protein [Photobacterium sp. 1_MG-2023]|uniref:SNF2-related protein n=1 Tax=Photobacterium sp. 1_MG-2023 TaxID=3062646 RepID=UPI0026E48704|nr:SNF2-related protein [Photobacterium sp. 1_MG-2023]MDO6705519.1 SNF2-related protein [Photobacterium sp. 1_MG-2023]